MFHLQPRGGNILLALLVAIHKQGKAIAFQVTNVDVEERTRERQIRRQTALRNRNSGHSECCEARNEAHRGLRNIDSAHNAS